MSANSFVAIGLNSDDKPGWVSVNSSKLDRAMTHTVGGPWEYSWGGGPPPSEADIAEAERLERLVLK